MDNTTTDQTPPTDGIIKILIGILVLLVVAVIIFFIVKTDDYASSPNTSDWQKYTNEEYGFEFELPGYFSETYEDRVRYTWAEEGVLERTMYISDHYDYLEIEIKKGDLDGEIFSHDGDWFPLTYHSETDSWIPQYELNENELTWEDGNGSAYSVVPERVQSSDYNMFLVHSAEGGGHGEYVWIEALNQKYYIKIITVRSNDTPEGCPECPETAFPHTNADTTMKIIKTFDFVN